LKAISRLGETLEVMDVDVSVRAAMAH